MIPYYHCANVTTTTTLNDDGYAPDPLDPTTTVRTILIGAFVYVSLLYPVRCFCVSLETNL